jgi:pyruvate/2-oxoglutarate dehydrogenase complex dihydrolipoamide dehydrogenase (E3) component
MKALVAAHDDLILGFTMIGPEAGEVMAAVQMTILVGLPYTRMAEGLGALFSNVRNLTTDRPRHH